MKTGIVPSSRVTPRRGLRAASYVAPCARVNAAIDKSERIIAREKAKLEQLRRERRQILADNRLG